jgi:N6-L-threonylcarbamoyladenine synthase
VGRSPRGLCLAIETSCDETAAAVVAEGRHVLSDVVASQADLHARTGGVVPEVAARHHLEALLPVVEAALRGAGVGWDEVALVAVTRGPGLPAALLVGVAAAKALAFAAGVPVVGVNHLAGHVYAHRLAVAGGVGGGPSAPPGADGLPRPAVCLVVSGSHSDLCLLPAGGGLDLLGSTVDDAAGEAFDKVARLLGLGYPGGPRLDRLAAQGNPRAVAFPRTLRPLSGPRGGSPSAAGLGGPYAFSFSGLKTAVAQQVAARGRGALGAEGSGPLPPQEAADIAASFQAAVVDVLVERTVRAAEAHGVRTLLACGGVAANSALRAALAAAAQARGWAWAVPPPRYCTDNAAMIAAAGWVAFQAGRSDGWDLDADPNLPLAL